MDLISSYSSLIELFAALYTTMAIESDFFRRIWNPQDKEAVNRILQEQDRTDDTGKHFEIISEYIDTLNDKMALMTNRRGGFMLSLCVLLLILCGQEFDISLFSLGCMLIAAGLIMIFNRFLLSKWKTVVFFVSLLPTILFICNRIEIPEVFLQNDFVHWLLNNVNILLVIVVIIPVLHHLLVNWMYHSVYSGYLKTQLMIDICDYNSAREDLHQHREENFDIDDSLVEATLKEKLARACTPSIFMLTRSLIKFKQKRITDAFKRKLEQFLVKMTRILHTPSKPMGVRKYVSKK